MENTNDVTPADQRPLISGYLLRGMFPPPMAAVILRINMNVETANVTPGVPEDRLLQINNEKAKAPEVWPTSMWGLAANEQPQAAERTKDATTSAALQSLDQIAGFGGDPEKPKMTGYFYFLESEGEIRGSPQMRRIHTPVSL